MPVPKTRLRKTVLLTVAALYLHSPLSGFADQTIQLDTSDSKHVFEGVGAVSGGGATSVLLKDYPEPQRAQILDILFKPNFAASMSTLYIEVPGDGNSTQGTEPSHMHSRTDENYYRGYEWWLMSEAKKRNPTLTLDACAWSAPGWVGDGEFWSQDTADYYVKWIKGLKSEHGLNLNAIGCRNEKGVNVPWLKLFRKTLNANGLKSVRLHAFDVPGNPRMWDWLSQFETDKELEEAIDVLGNHTLTLAPLTPETRARIDKIGKPVWNTEEHVYSSDGRRFEGDWNHAIACLHLFNNNFIDGAATRIVNWYLAGSTYPNEPYGDEPAALIANSPWSGYYRVKPIIWAYAHYGQFVKIGWTYVPSGCVKLSDGGTIVTLRSPVPDPVTGVNRSVDYSIIAETSGAKAPQTITLQIPEGLSNKALCCWKTTEQEQFVKQADVTPKDGTLTITLEPNAMYSFSTTTGQQKGEFKDIPADKPFPLPYAENFDSYKDAKQWGYYPHYTADICGVFQLAQRPDRQGMCLEQVLSTKANSWAPEWMPYTIIGDIKWTDYQISTDISFNDGGWAGVMGRVTETGNGWDGNPSGYYARLYPDGGVSLYVASRNMRGSKDKQIGTGTAPQRNGGGGASRRGQPWHKLAMKMQGSTITVSVDGNPVITADDKTWKNGMAGLITGGEGKARNKALFDNLLIAEPNAPTTQPAMTLPQVQPLYP